MPMTQFNDYLFGKAFSDFPVIFIIVHCSHPSQHLIICMHEYMNMDAFVFLHISILFISPKEICAVRRETISFPLTNVGCMTLDK